MTRRLIYCFCVVVAFSETVHCQKVFHFDYYTSYDYRKNEQEAVSATTVIFSNSENPQYFLTMHFINNVLQENVNVTDFENKKIYHFPGVKTVEELKNESFESAVSTPLSIKNWEESRKSYVADYKNTGDLNNNTIEIKVYKNEKRKKLIESLFIKIVPTQLTKNQKYNFGPLIFPLLTKKLDLKEEGLITEAYSVEEGKKINIRRLVEIKKADFTITMTTNK